MKSLILTCAAVVLICLGMGLGLLLAPGSKPEKPPAAKLLSLPAHPSLKQWQRTFRTVQPTASTQGAIGDALFTCSYVADVGTLEEPAAMNILVQWCVRVTPSKEPKA